MEGKYKNPPLVEALCEFKFIPGTSWDITIPGIIYERIKNDFPEKKHQIGIGITLQPKEKGIEQKIEQTPPRIQFFNKDKTALVQVAPDLLVVNQLKPYQGWNKFKPIILKIFDLYREIANPKGLKRIGLRYINIFEFPDKIIELKDYFRYYPMIPETLPQSYDSFLIRTEFPHDNREEVLIISLGSIIPRSPDISSIVLDIDYAMISPGHISLDNIDIWLEKAHRLVEDSFEKIITDKSRDFFIKG